jgi:hypothetical protein
MIIDIVFKKENKGERASVLQRGIASMKISDANYPLMC